MLDFKTKKCVSSLKLVRFSYRISHQAESIRKAWCRCCICQESDGWPINLMLPNNPLTIAPDKFPRSARFSVSDPLPFVKYQLLVQVSHQPRLGNNISYWPNSSVLGSQLTDFIDVYSITATSLFRSVSLVRTGCRFWRCTSSVFVNPFANRLIYRLTAKGNDFFALLNDTG